METKGTIIRARRGVRCRRSSREKVSCISFVSFARRARVSRRSPRGAFRSPSKRSPLMMNRKRARQIQIRAFWSQLIKSPLRSFVTHCHVAPRSAGGAARRPGRARRARAGRARGRSGDAGEAARAQVGHGQGADGADGDAQRDGGERGTHLELEQAHDAPVAGRGLEAARAHRGGAGAHSEGKRPSRGFGPSRRDRRGHRRTRAKPLGETRLGSPRRERLLGARRVCAVAARVRVVVRPAERVRRGARSGARDERGVRPPARERAPGARGRIGGARAGWRDPPRPRRASGAETPGGAARLAARLRAARAECARERPLNERASGCVAPPTQTT